jgi:hypothetical protein
MAVVSAKMVDGRLKIHVDLQKGDLPGHPFRGNQWAGGRGDASLAEGATSKPLSQLKPTKERPSENQTENFPEVPYPKLSDRHPIYGELKSTTKENKKIVTDTLDRLADEYELPPLGIKVKEFVGRGMLGTASKGMTIPIDKSQVKELKDQGENVIGMVKMGTDGRGPDDRVWYHNHMGGAEISICTGEGGSKRKSAFGAPEEKFRESYGSSGFHPRTGRHPAEDVIVHEFGHVLARRVMGQKDGGAPAPVEIAKKISGYARESLGECIAEAFVMHDAGNREPWLTDFLESTIKLSERRRRK